MRELNPCVCRAFGNVYYLNSLSPIQSPFDQFQIIRSKHRPPQIKKKSSRIKFQFSTNISLLSSQVGKTKLYILLTIKKVLLNKPSKHQIEIPSFLKDCTIFSFSIFSPSFWPFLNPGGGTWQY